MSLSRSRTLTWLLALSPVALFATGVKSQKTSPGLVPRAYNPLPLGTVKPAGWLQDQLDLQVNGLAGHEHEFYTWISETDWLGGTAAYSNLEEAGPYWLNGLVPTAVLSSSPSLLNQTAYFIDYTLSHQESSGWFGPEVYDTSKPRFLWARYLFLLGATQMADADPESERTQTIVNAMHKFVGLANGMLKSGEGLDDGGWGKVRWQEFVISLQWLYENYPNGNEALLLETMQLARSTGNDWNSVFAPENFPTSAVTPSTTLNWHGVNVAEALHAAAVGYRFSHNATDLAAIGQAWDIVFKYHGRPSGIFAADEYLAGLEAARGSELCLVVELMFSGSYVFQLLGDTQYADRVERIAYNALPATITGNMWSHQYLQQQNQIGALNMNPNPFPGDGSYSNVFGLEPNYPCCTVNHPQGFSKFISSAFVVTPDAESLVHVYLGPFSVKTTLANDNDVSVAVDTNYPFSDVLTTTITAAKAFTYYVRIPSWVVDGTIAVNGGEGIAVAPTEGLQAVAVGAGTTTFVLNLPAPITIENRLHGAVAIHRGPLHYAYQIAHNDTELPSNQDRFSEPQPLAVDLQFNAAAPWAFAIDPTKLTFNPAPDTAKLASPIFADSQPPLTITALACQITWNTGGETFATAPPENATCTGPSQNITLYPYGATKLRIGEIPTVSLA